MGLGRAAQAHYKYPAMLTDGTTITTVECTVKEATTRDNELFLTAKACVEAWRNGGACLVHCNGGVHRAPVLLVAFAKVAATGPARLFLTHWGGPRSLAGRQTARHSPRTPTELSPHPFSHPPLPPPPHAQRCARAHPCRSRRPSALRALEGGGLHLVLGQDHAAHQGQAAVRMVWFLKAIEYTS